MHGVQNRSPLVSIVFEAHFFGAIVGAKIK
jgi:hypothetical protein